MRVDTCSTCENFHLSIPNEYNLSKKSQLKLLQTTHLKEADYFYQSYKDLKINKVNITMDMMSNQQSPRTNIGESYFLSKIQVQLLTK